MCGNMDEFRYKKVVRSVIYLQPYHKTFAQPNKLTHTYVFVLDYFTTTAQSDFMQMFVYQALIYRKTNKIYAQLLGRKTLGLLLTWLFK